MIPRRIQLSRSAGWRMPDNTVKVDRSTKWGNPFVVGEDGDREECLMKFRALLCEGFVTRDTSTSIEAQRAFASHAAAYLKTIRGKNLACWCRLDQRCHADLLLEVANRPTLEQLATG